MVGKNSVIARLAVSNLIDTLTDDDFFNVLYVSRKTLLVLRTCREK
jgi:hypothetical protein